MKQRAIKMPDELWAAVQQSAKWKGVTAGEFVRHALERATHLRMEPAVRHPDARRLTQREAFEQVTPPFACPVCRRGFASAVRCGCSNRLAVPVE